MNDKSFEKFYARVKNNEDLRENYSEYYYEISEAGGKPLSFKKWVQKQHYLLTGESN